MIEPTESEDSSLDSYTNTSSSMEEDNDEPDQEMATQEMKPDVDMKLKPCLKKTKRYTPKLAGRMSRCKRGGINSFSRDHLQQSTLDVENFVNAYDEFQPGMPQYSNTGWSQHQINLFASQMVSSGYFLCSNQISVPIQLLQQAMQCEIGLRKKAVSSAAIDTNPWSVGKANEMSHRVVRSPYDFRLD